MRKRVILMTVLIGMCVNGYGADGAAILARYLAIGQSEADAGAAMKKTNQYLVSLNRDDFLSFVREITRQLGDVDKNSDSVMAMGIYAKCYKEGAGKSESLLLSLRQLSDATLPVSWRMGLFYVLKPDKRVDLTKEEVAMVISILDEAGQSKQNSEVFRFFCLRELGAVLYMQRELVIKKAPELKEALARQDLTALPQSGDATVKRAANLIGAIQGYKAELNRTADEVKDVKLKASLQKCLTQWESVSVAPTK